MKVFMYSLPETGTTILTYKISSALGESTQIIFEPEARDKSIEKPGNIVTECLLASILPRPERQETEEKTQRKDTQLWGVGENHLVCEEIFQRER